MARRLTTNQGPFCSAQPGSRLSGCLSVSTLIQLDCCVIVFSLSGQSLQSFCLILKSGEHHSNKCFFWKTWRLHQWRGGLHGMWWLAAEQLTIKTLCFIVLLTLWLTLFLSERVTFSSLSLKKDISQIYLHKENIFGSATSPTSYIYSNIKFNYQLSTSSIFGFLPTPAAAVSTAKGLRYEMMLMIKPFLPVSYGDTLNHEKHDLKAISWTWIQPPKRLNLNKQSESVTKKTLCFSWRLW